MAQSKCKYRTRLCWEGWYYLVVLCFIVGGAITREINLLLVVAGVLVGPLIVSWRLVRQTLFKLSVVRKLPSGIGAGDRLVVEVDVCNERNRLPSWGLVVTDRIRRNDDQNQSDEEAIQVFYPHIRAGETCQSLYEGRLHDRGCYTFGPLQISTRFPLGLLSRTATYAEVKQLFVYPRLGQLTAKWYQNTQVIRMGSRQTQPRRGHVEGEFYGLRDHRDGDSHRWIHWRTTARRNKLTVREFERQQNQNLALLLDLWNPDVHDEVVGQRVELAISFAATAFAMQCRRGNSAILLGIAGREIEIVAGQSSAGLLEQAMEKLALARGYQEDTFPELLDDALARIRPSTKTVIVSTRRVDLSDTSRFTKIWQEPRKRSSLNRIQCIRIGTPEFDSYFVPHENES